MWSIPARAKSTCSRYPTRSISRSPSSTSKVYTRAFNRRRGGRGRAANARPAMRRARHCSSRRATTTPTSLWTSCARRMTEEHGPQPHDLVEKITGSVDRPLDRIKAFKNDPRPKYVVTVDLLTTGIDVPAISNLVFVRRVNSRILYEQMIGRATRRCRRDRQRVLPHLRRGGHLRQPSGRERHAAGGGRPGPVLRDATSADLERAPTDEDARFVRDQIVVKLRARLKHLDPARRRGARNRARAARRARQTGSSPPRPREAERTIPAAPHRLPPCSTARSARLATSAIGLYISEHDPDEIVSASRTISAAAPRPADYIAEFRGVRARVI